MSGGGLAFVLVFGFGIWLVPDADAFHIDLEQRRAEREAEREARYAEREAEREARRATKSFASRRAERERETEEIQEETSCSCRARLDFAKSDLQFRGGSLSFVPRVDVSIRSEGEVSDPPLNVSIAYEGGTSYQSEDVAVPPGATFGGTKNVVENGACGSRYSYTGLPLSPIPVSLSGLTRALLGGDQAINGVVRMSAQLVGCGFEEEDRQFVFTAEEFGNLKVRGWRSVR